VDNVVSMEAHRRSRIRGSRPRPRARATVSFAFDLASPATYLAAERVDRLFPGVTWVPALGEALRTGPRADARDRERERAIVRARAAELRMPLVWPERPAVGLPAMRIAQHAADRGRAGEFVLAASRLAFCGGFDLDDPEILAEAAAAAGLSLEESLRAAGDRARDAELEAAGRRLLARGADRLPVVRVGRLLFAGEERVAEAAAAARGTFGAATVQHRL
jgi:2-hydroxychromene-2-carboxylate isomerase